MSETPAATPHEAPRPVTTETVIVGAGPAGLATAGRLARLGRPHRLLDRAERVADAWHRHYDRLHLHTVKETSHLPHKPFPPGYPRYVPRRKLLAYFDEYVAELGLEPRLGEEVVAVEPDGAGRWRTRTAAGAHYVSDHVVVCTGFNRVPHQPTWPGLADYTGEVIHSRSYRNAEPFRDRDVLVVGMGNTGAEIALDLLEGGARPTISVRGPVNIVPRDVLGRPTQLTAMLLARLPERLGDALGVVLRQLTVGDLSRWGIATPDEPPAAQLRRHGKTPVIDVGTLARIKRGDIAVLPGIERLEADEAVFSDGSRQSFDAVVLATGYRSRVEDIVPAAAEVLDGHGHPGVVSAPPPHSGLHFVGFDGYSVGGLLNAIRRDSAKVANAITGSAAT